MRHIKDYLILKEIGSGMFAKVYKCKNLKTNTIYACKAFDRVKMTKKAI